MVLELVEGLNLSPRQAADELANDRGHWASRILPVKQYLDGRRLMKQAEAADARDQVPGSVQRLVAEVDALRIKAMREGD